MSRVFHEMRNAIKCTNALYRLRNKIALISALQQSKAFSTVIHTSFPVKMGVRGIRYIKKQKENLHDKNTVRLPRQYLPLPDGGICYERPRGKSRI